MARKSVGQLVLVVVLGALFGSLLGQLLGLILPAGVVKEFFLRSAEFGFSPTTVSVGFMAVTLGFNIKLNVVGILGVALAAYILRWYL
ncbi:MAG: DUF4321 domain-containing protein [Calditrichaeota bacterium]|nr:MAG: DUF4321 domain-containing protein [Calditrichota bacterium]